MSRTTRVKRKTDKKVRDGVVQYVDSRCRHHGSCSYCRNNRLFDMIKTHQNKLYKNE